MAFVRHFVWLLGIALLVGSATEAGNVPRGLTIIPDLDGSQLQIVPGDYPPSEAVPTDETIPARQPPTGLRMLEPAPRVPETTGGYRKTALVFGNGGYVHAPALANTRRDAELIAATFQQMGLGVWLGLDLNHVEMRKITRDFVERSTNTDLIAFYYAGHGFEIRGRNMILPTDADITDPALLEAQVIEIDSIIRLIEGTGANTIVFIDACRSNPFPEDLGTQLETPAVGLAKMEARLGTMVNYATAPGGLAFDGDGPNSPFATALAMHLPTPGLPVELALVRVRRDVVQNTGGRQVPWSHSSLLEEIALVPGATMAGGAANPPLHEPREVDPDLREFLAEANDLTVNGQHIAIRNAATEGGIEDALGYLRGGLNYLRSGAQRMRVWFDDQSAYVFEHGYEESHAILVAIDDYPSSTGFGRLGFMESHARALADRLATMGFPRENIVELYGPDATRDRITAALEPFWGQKRDGQSRLLIYYGGHGSHIERDTGIDATPKVLDGILIPFDYDPARPYQSAIRLEDLDNHIFRRSVAHHTMILIDACSSGLILRQYAGDDAAEAPREFSASQRWHRIRTDLENRHTSMIVAGTGDERALYENGGVFTKALLDGLNGWADGNKDGIISYDELTAYLSEEVRLRTADVGVSQSPAHFAAGRGRFLFEWGDF